MSARSILKHFIPKRYRTKLKIFYKRLPYLGSSYKCPYCDLEFRKFMTYGPKHRKNAQCPVCGCLERHRLLWFYLRDKTDLFSKKNKLLHFAPEKFVTKLLVSLPNIEYTSADINPDKAMVQTDITNIKFEDNRFDVILCLHVLEHIIDDKKAIGELFRVLKPNGYAIVQVPNDHYREITYEDKNITSPEEREKTFGQKDHVRLYGMDIKDRLEQIGFDVRVDNYAQELGTDMIKRYGLLSEENLYFCRKHIVKK